MTLHEKIKQLEAVAEKATPGEWEADHKNDLVWAGSTKVCFGNSSTANRKHIATFNPDMAKKLIAIIIELLGQRDFLKETLKEHVANVNFTDDTECLWKILEGK